jgi:hypothetical protein
LRCAGRTITRTLTAPRPGESGRSGGRAATDRGRSAMACPWAPRVRSPGAPRLLVLRHKEPGRLAAASPSDGPRRSGPSDLVSVPAVSRTATGQLRRRRPVARSPKRSARLSRRDRRLPDDFDAATPAVGDRLPGSLSSEVGCPTLPRRSRGFPQRSSPRSWFPNSAHRRVSPPVVPGRKPSRFASVPGGVRQFYARKPNADKGFPKLFSSTIHPQICPQEPPRFPLIRLVVHRFIHRSLHRQINWLDSTATIAAV